MTAALKHERIACLYRSDANGFWQILLDENTSDATCGTVPLLHILDNQVNICLYEYMMWNKVKAVFMNKCKHLKFEMVDSVCSFGKFKPNCDILWHHLKCSQQVLHILILLFENPFLTVDNVPKEIKEPAYTWSSLFLCVCHYANIIK